MAEDTPEKTASSIRVPEMALKCNKPHRQHNQTVVFEFCSRKGSYCLCLQLGIKVQSEINKD